MDKTKEIKSDIPFAKIWQFTEGFRGVFLAVLGLIFVIEIANLLTPYLVGKLIDTALAGGAFSNAVILILGIMFAKTSVIFLGAVKDALNLFKIEYSFMHSLIKNTFLRFFTYPVGQLTNQNSSFKLNVFSKGESGLANTVGTFVDTVLPIFIQMVVTIVAISVINPILGAIAAFFALIYIFLGYRFNLSFYPNLQKNNDSWNANSKERSEIIRYAGLVKLSGAEEKITKEFEREHFNLGTYSKKMWLGANLEYYWRTFLSTVGQVFIMGLAVYFVYQKTLTPGTLVVVFAWISTMFSYLGIVGWAQRRLMKASADIDTYAKLLEEKPWLEEKSGTIKRGLVGQIEFSNVSFSYPKDESGKTKKDKSWGALKNISFSINSGETVAFVGHSGAGKSTIIQLLLRAYDPTAGEIIIDGNNLKELDIVSYRRQIGYVEQSVELFDKTLRENILFGVAKEEIFPEDKLEEVAKKARVSEFYHRLGKEKFETIIGEKGIRLSGGERQRVGIARALIREPKILIFDEATSSLDSENESLIHEAMNDALIGRTGIIVAHRLSTVKDADKIIVLENGAIVDIGTHDELLASCEPYKRLVEHQVVTV